MHLLTPYGLFVAAYNISFMPSLQASHSFMHRTSNIELHRLYAEAVLQINVGTQCIFYRRLPPVNADKVLTQIETQKKALYFQTFPTSPPTSYLLTTCLHLRSAMPRHLPKRSQFPSSTPAHPKRCISPAHPCPIRLWLLPRTPLSSLSVSLRAGRFV